MQFLPASRLPRRNQGGDSAQHAPFPAFAIARMSLYSKTSPIYMADARRYAPIDLPLGARDHFLRLSSQGKTNSKAMLRILEAVLMAASLLGLGAVAVPAASQAAANTAQSATATARAPIASPTQPGLIDTCEEPGHGRR